MAKWKNGNGPALWPIDMSQISKVLFVAIPQTDTYSTLVEAEIEQECSGVPECPIHLKTDTVINNIINALCERLGRRTPDSIECTKSSLNTDTLRSVLKAVLLTVRVPSEQETKKDLDSEKVSKDTNEWGICYDNLRNSYIDVEYETIFGNTKVVIAQYNSKSQSIVIEAKCEQCLITRADDGSIADINEQELRDIEWQTGPFVCSVSSEMVYLISAKRGDEVFKTDKMTIRRPLEFIFEPECPIFLEDGPERQQLPKQNISSPFCLDNAKFSVVGTNGVLEVNGTTLDLGSTECCRANIAKVFFKRSNSNTHKKIELVDIYDAMRNNTKQWNEPGVAKTFAKTVSAARIKLNSDIAKTFKLDDDKIFQQNEKQIFINPKYLSSLKKKKQKS
jgi:hypothetical protein